MKHCIIVKFSDTVTDKPALTARIEALFSNYAAVPGVSSCRVVHNCVSRSNRYDLAIVLDMPASALEVWDASELHRTWKSDFGGCIQAKAIFDFED